MAASSIPTRSTTLHDLDNTEALQPRRRWHLEFDLHAASFIWDGTAESERDAIDKAHRALRCEGLDETARVAICLERTA